jgi:hypothetical protein
MSLNGKLEEDREYAAADIGLEMKVAKLAQIIEVLIDHAPEQAKDRVNALLGG